MKRIRIKGDLSTDSFHKLILKIEISFIFICLKQWLNIVYRPLSFNILYINLGKKNQFYFLKILYIYYKHISLKHNLKAY